MRTVSDCRTIHGAQAATLLTPVLARYEVQRTFSKDSRIDLHLALEAGADPEPILRTMPTDLDKGYCTTAPKVAVAVQEALRAWLPYVILSDLRSFEDTSAVLVLGYGCCRPVRPRNSRSYNLDILDADTHRVIESSVLRGIPRKLRQLYPILCAMGFPRPHRFAPRRQFEVLQRFQRLWHHVSAMLVAERGIVDFYVGAGSRQRDWDRARRNLGRNLKRLLNGAECEALETILDMEVARAISRIKIELTIHENPAAPPALSEHADSAPDRHHCGLVPACAT